MNKLLMTLPLVAVLGLTACGEEASTENTTTNILSGLEETTDQYVSDVTKAIETGVDATAEATANFVTDAEAAADQAFESAAEYVEESVETLEPAAGTVETATEIEIKN